MRFAFDTNVLISAMLFERSKPAQAVLAAARLGEILVSSELLHETHRILMKGKFDPYLSIEQREEFLAALIQNGTLIEPSETITACRDPKDDMLLELAVAGKANAIISGDQDLLALHPFREISILSPDAFIEKFSPE